MKKYQVVFSRLALDDIEQAVTYYNKQQKDSANELPHKFKSHPQPSNATHSLVPSAMKNVRCAQVPKFPFLVHYLIDETSATVTIAAVYSTYQQP